MVLKGLHLVAKGLVRSAGFRMELRRSGDLKLGLWRKPLRKGVKPAHARRLVFVPGFGDTPLSWVGVVMLLAPVLRRRYDEVVLIDFPGFQGFLSRERSFHSMDLLMEKVFDALDTLQPRALVGHSLGGWLVGRYAGLCGAGERPGSVRRGYTGPETAVLVDPSGVIGSESLRQEWRERFRRMVETGYEELRPHVFGREPFWFKYFLSEFKAFAEKEEIVQFLRSVRDEHEVEDLLPSMRARVWLLWGERDTLTPPEFSYAWHRGLPADRHAGTVFLRGIGHSPQLESPAVTAAALGLMLTGGSSRLFRHPLAARWYSPRYSPSRGEARAMGSGRPVLKG